MIYKIYISRYLNSFFIRYSIEVKSLNIEFFKNNVLDFFKSV